MLLRTSSPLFWFTVSKLILYQRSFFFLFFFVQFAIWKKQIEARQISIGWFGVKFIVPQSLDQKKLSLCWLIFKTRTEGIYSRELTAPQALWLMRGLNCCNLSLASAL